ncbi:MAG: cyclodeaminase/cyclohydrolase family protein [Deltaproteobacteria bacterium]|nr:cyclodeaminase/cyclohydrolase family protein [Deltaproteobacteria bacterium]MBW2308092.1 cyclodeaminase/cyclohydrolase family protein [Deltaproteobacteria bacterium]
MYWTILPASGVSVTALGGVLAASLISMVCRLTIGKNGYDEALQEEMKRILRKSENLRKELVRLIGEDAQS